jgi:CubicO group peptidase (beta-lactamase class C family)
LASKKKSNAKAAEAPSAATLDSIFAGLNRSDAPGAVVGVAHAGKTLYRRGFGLASLEHGVANTPATRMRIGSTSKHMACMAALLLANESKLDLDAPASRHLPELPELMGMPTLRQFMSHTSGYRDYLDLAYTAAGMAIQPAGKALAAQLRQTEANFSPGEAQLYCNGGYHLLSIAIERAAGIPFEQFLKTRLFGPLGMHDTESVPSDMQIKPGVATMHVPRPDGSWRRGIFPTEEIRGEGAVVSTVDDMLTWLAHLRRPTAFGSADIWRQLSTVATLNNGLVTTYALGLWRHRYRGLEIVYHSGNVIGGACQMLTVPAHALDVVIITNGALVNPVELAKKVIDLVLAEHVHGELPTMASSKPYGHLFGTRYHSASGLVIGFDDVQGRLGISLQLSPPAPVLRDEGELLRVAFEDVAMGPFVLRVADLAPAADGGAPAVLPVSECGNVERYRRLPAKAPTTAKAGQPLVGRYRSHDLDTEALIAFEGDVLTMRYRGSYGSLPHTLDAVSASVFGVTVGDEFAPARYALTVERERGKVSGFRISSSRTRHLWFERLPDRAAGGTST